MGPASLRPRARLRRRRRGGPVPGLMGVVAVAGLVGMMLAGCSGGSAAPGHPVAAAGCATPFQERLDPQSARHLFPGAAEPVYLSDPPTSGPHRLGPPPTGAVATPIPRPVQVAMLESGFVIVQYRDLAPGAVAQLSALAGDRVTVAPAANLPAPVVATAWTWKVECGTVDAGALAAFIAARRGRGFSHA